MQIPWDVIIPLVVDMIRECIANGQQPADQIRRPRGLARLRLERKIRTTMGLSARDWRRDGAAIMAEVYAEAEAATDADIQELVERAQADDD